MTDEQKELMSRIAATKEEVARATSIAQRSEWEKELRKLVRTLVSYDDRVWAQKWQNDSHGGGRSRSPSFGHFTNDDKGPRS